MAAPSPPCKSRKALKGDKAEPVSRNSVTRAFIIYARFPTTSVKTAP